MTGLTPAQLARIRAVVLEKANTHKELRRRLTLAGARRVLLREGVALSIRLHPRPAQLIRLPQGWKVVVDSRSSDRERVVCIAHELGHLWLHHDADRDEPIVFDRTEPADDAIREAEADHVAELLVGGAVQLPKAKPVVRRRRHRTLDEPVTDADDSALLSLAIETARREATPAPPTTGPRVQFAVDRRAWQSVRFHGLGRYPHYATTTSVPDGTDYAMVSCDLEAAVAIVEQLARAGHKRTAVQVRRIVRQAAGQEK